MEEKKKNYQEKVGVTNVEEEISDEEMARIQGGSGMPGQGYYTPESGGISVNNSSTTTIKIRNPKI